MDLGAARVFVAALLGCAVICPPLAWADDTEQAEALVLAGVEDFKAGRYGEAVSSFLEAKQLFDDPNLDWNIARAFEELGDCANARDWFEQVQLRQPSHSEDRKQVKQNARAAKKKLAELAACPPSAAVEVLCADDEARVQLDQRPSLPCPVTLRLVEGEHELVASLEGAGTERKLVSVRGGNDTQIAFETLVKSPGVVTVGLPDPEPPPSPTWMGRRTVIFWSGAGAGAAGLLAIGTSFYFAGVTGDYQSQYDTLIAQPRLDDAERQRVRTLQEDGESAATTADVLRFGGIGLLLVGAGLVVADLWLDSGGAPTEETATWSLVPTAGGVAAGFGLTF